MCSEHSGVVWKGMEPCSEHFQAPRYYPEASVKARISVGISYNPQPWVFRLYSDGKVMPIQWMTHPDGRRVGYLCACILDPTRRSLCAVPYYNHGFSIPYWVPEHAYLFFSSTVPETIDLFPKTFFFFHVLTFVHTRQTESHRFYFFIQCTTIFIQ